MDDVQPTLGRRRAIVALVLVNAMWGSSFPMMKCLNLQIDQHFAVTELTASSWLRSGSAAWMIAIRFSIALLLLAVLFRGMIRQVRFPHVLSGMAIGTVFFFGLLLQVIGLATIPASRSGFLTSLAVAFTPSMFATTAVLASIVFLVIRVRVPDVPASAQSGGVWFSLAVQPRFFLSIGLLCIFPTLLAFAWMNKFQPCLSAVQAAVIYTLEPVFAALWAMFLPTLLAVLCAVVYSNEQLSLPLLIGGTLVLIANVLALWPLPVDPPLLARKRG